MGVVIGVAVLTFLVVMHEFGHFLAAKRFGVRVDVFSVGFGPKLISKKFGETEYAISLIPLGGYVKMAGEHPGGMVEPERSFEGKPVWQRLVIVLAGPGASILLAVLLLGASYAAFGVPTTTTEIGAVLLGSPAEGAGVQVGDIVLAVGLVEEQGRGGRVHSWENLVSFISSHPGREVFFLVSRADGDHVIRMTPNPTVGISPAPPVYERNILSAPLFAVRDSYRIIVLTTVGFWQLITGKLGSDALGGPVTIVRAAGLSWAGAGFTGVLFFGAVITINLGILNLLPIPMLDGGHIPFLLYEAVRGRPIKRSVRESVGVVGLVVLLLLMVFAFYNDISRLVGK